MIELRLRIELIVIGPFNTKGAAVGGYGVDAVLLRDANDRPLLPGSQVKGRVRDGLEDLNTVLNQQQLTDDLQEWLGPEVDTEDDQIDKGMRPHAWHFEDLVTTDDVLQQMDSGSNLLTRVAIDRKTGAAKSQALLVAETAGAPGQAIPFTGSVTISGWTAGDVIRAAGCLYRALCWTPNFGAYRSVGFGRLANVALVAEELTYWDDEPAARATLANVMQQINHLSGSPRLRFLDPPTAPVKAGEHYHLDVTVHKPFCVGQRRTSRNLLSTHWHLSGAVLKGAVANQLRRVLGVAGHRTPLAGRGKGTRWEKLCDHFGVIRFCTAFPLHPEYSDRPVVPPLSLVLGANDKQYRDVALCEEPFLFKDGNGAVMAPMFAPDWKPADIPPFAGRPEKPKIDLRMHTTIDPNHRRVKKQHLFAYELVRPENLVWRGLVDVSAVPVTDHPAVLAQLHAFLKHATLRIGKTKAPATAAIGNAMPLTPAPHLEPEGVWVLVLQSPALLADPRELAKHWSLDGPDPLAAEYQRMFQELSSGTLSLSRFFADQELHGGFLARRSGDNVYNSFTVTSAGSVFVLAPTGDIGAAQTLIEKWSRGGLPLPNWAKQLYGEDFTTNAFLPADGFGEILVNHPCHKKMKPIDTEIKVLS